MKTRVKLATLAVTGLALAGGQAAAAASAQAATPTEKVSTTGTDTGNCVTAPCATINYAISQATAGETIDVAAGTYNQTVDITKPINLAGAGKAKTTIDGTGLDPSADSYFGIVYVGSVGGTVDIHGFTITNPYPYAYTSGEPMAIVLEDANAGDDIDIYNNDIVEGSSDTSASTDFPIGIDTFVNAAMTTIRSNTISGFFQGALLEDNGPAFVDGNKFTGLISGGSFPDVYPAEGLFFLADEGGTYPDQDADANVFSGYSGYGIAEDAGYTGGYVTPTCVANGSIVTDLNDNVFELSGGQTATGLSLVSDGTGNDLSGLVSNEFGYVTAPSLATEIQAIAAPATPAGTDCGPYSTSNGGAGTLEIAESHVDIGVRTSSSTGGPAQPAGVLGSLHVPIRH